MRERGAAINFAHIFTALSDKQIHRIPVSATGPLGAFLPAAAFISFAAHGSVVALAYFKNSFAMCFPSSFCISSFDWIRSLIQY